MSNVSHAIIIDDDIHSAKVLEIMLIRYGMTVTLINDPAYVQDTLTAVPDPTVIFVDLEMPHLDGYEVLALVRATLGERVPVVAHTVHTSEANNADRHGFNGFFSKPLNGLTFAGNLQRLLNGERVWALS